MQELEKEVERLKQHFDEIEHERELAYSTMRELRRISTRLVRDMQRDMDLDIAGTFAECKQLADKLSAAPHQFGFIEEALIEYAEAAITHALLNNLPEPTMEALGCTERSYVLGLADAISELRRRVLTLMRKDDLDGATRLFDLMDRLFLLLMVFDHTEAVLPVRRKQDALRAVVERTRADLTSVICQKRLEVKLAGESK